jgi:hypothetical protein
MGHLTAAIVLTPELEATQTGTGNTVFYCKIQNHTQEECRKRIQENKPCKDKQGHAYWLKVYVTSNGNS